MLAYLVVFCVSYKQNKTCSVYVGDYMNKNKQKRSVISALTSFDFSAKSTGGVRKNPSDDRINTLRDMLLVDIVSDIESPVSFISLYSDSVGEENNPILKALMLDTNRHAGSKTLGLLKTFLEQIPLTPEVKTKSDASEEEIARKKSAAKGYHAGIRHLLYILLASGFQTRPALAECFSSYARIEPKSNPGQIFSYVADAAARLCKDISYIAICSNKYSQSQRDTLLADLTSYWFEYLGGDAFEEGICQNIIANCNSRQKDVNDVFRRSLTSFSKEALAGILSFMGYFFYLKGRNDGLLKLDVDFLFAVTSGDEKAKAKFVSENRINIPGLLDPRQDPQYKVDPANDEMIEETVSRKDKQGNITNVVVKTPKSKKLLEIAIAEYDAKLADVVTKTYEALENFFPESNLPQLTNDEKFKKGPDGSLEPLDAKSLYLKRVTKLRGSFARNNDNLCRLGMRYLLGINLYTSEIFTGSSRLSVLSNSEELLTGAFSSKKDLNACVGDMLNLANVGFMISPATAETPIELDMTKYTDKSLIKLSSEKNPVLEIFDVVTNAMFLFDYNHKITLINPMVLFTETPEGSKAQTVESYTLNSEVSAFQVLFGVGDNPANIITTGSFGMNWYSVYSNILFLSRTISSNYFGVGSSMPIPPETPSDLKDPDYIQRRDFYNDQVNAVNIRLQSFAAKKAFYESKPIAYQNMVENMRELPSLFLPPSENLSVEKIISRYVYGWQSQVEKTKTMGFKTYFQSMILPLVRSVGSMHVGELAYMKFFKGMDMLDSACKFMSAFKAVHGDGFRTFLEGKLISGLGADGVNIYNDILNGDKKDYQWALGKIFTGQGRSAKNDINKFREVVAALIARRSLSLSFLDLENNYAEKEMLLKNYKVESLGDLFVEKQGKIKFYDDFINIIENVEYLKSCSEGSDPSVLEKDMMQSIPSKMFDFSPYVIASLLEVGYASKDDLILLLDQFFENKDADTQNDLGWNAKDYVVLQLLEGSVNRFDSDDVKEILELKDLHEYAVNGPPSYLSKGSLELISRIAYYLLVSIKDYLKYSMNKTEGMDVVTNLQKNAKNILYTSHTKELIEGFLSYSDDEELGSFVDAVEPIDENSSRETFLRKKVSVEYFGFNIKGYKGKFDLVQGQNYYMIDSVKFYLFSYLITRQKAHYHTCGLDNALQTYLTPKNDLIGTSEIYKDADGSSFVLEGYLMAAGNPLMIFTGDALVSSCCMKPYDHGTDATCVSLISDRSLSFQILEINQKVSEDKINTKRIFAGSCFMEVPNKVERALYAHRIVLKGQTNTGDEHLSKEIDLSVFPGMASNNLQKQKDVTKKALLLDKYLQDKGMHAILLIDSLEVSVPLTNLLVTSEKTSMEGISFEDYIAAVSYIFSEKGLYVLIGGANFATDVNLDFSKVIHKSLTTIAQHVTSPEDFPPTDEIARRHVMKGGKDNTSDEQFFTYSMLPTPNWSNMLLPGTYPGPLQQTPSNLIPFLKFGSPYLKADTSSLATVDFTTRLLVDIDNENTKGQTFLTISRAFCNYPMFAVDYCKEDNRYIEITYALMMFASTNTLREIASLLGLPLSKLVSDAIIFSSKAEIGYIFDTTCGKTKKLSKNFYKEADYDEDPEDDDDELEIIPGYIPEE